MFLLLTRTSELLVQSDYDEVTLNRPKISPGINVIFWFCRLSLFRVALRISTETLSPHGLIPSWSGFLEFAVSFLTILLLHLPQDIQILLFELSRLLLHSIFGDRFLMLPNSPILQCQLSEGLLSKFSSPRSMLILERYLVRLSYHTDEVLLDLWLTSDNIWPLLQMEWLVLWIDSPNRFS